MIRPLSLRTRMMALFCLIVGVILSGFWIVEYSFYVRELKIQLDRRLLAVANPIIADLTENPNEPDLFQLDLGQQYLEVLDSSGRVLEMSKSLQGHSLPIQRDDWSKSETFFSTIQAGGLGRLRVACVPYRVGSLPLYLIIAEPTRDMEAALAHFRQRALLLVPFSLLLTAAVSAFYVGRSLRPVVSLTQHAADLTKRISTPTAAELQSPLPVINADDELGRLANTFNELYGQVTRALRQLRQFVSDASHELRTPLSVLQGETELLLAEPRTPAQYETAVRVIHSELRTLTRIVEGLFTLSMADAGQLRLADDPLYLDDVVHEACSITERIAHQKKISINCHLQQEVATRGDEALLRELFTIFLDNAVKYSPAGSRIFVRLSSSDGRARIEFQDEGMGIEPKHLPHIFDRFYRAATSDGGESRGGGLGLAIASAIVNAQQGTIACTTEPGTGSTFTIELPLRPVQVVIVS